jgi:two-component system chemotaxis sensor kinase CheA
MCTELAGKLNKKVRVEIRGDDIEADRSTLDLLKDPLTHILRNSLDHGLETPEQRQIAGKSQEGTIRVSASVDKQFYTVTVEDDGRGIDADRVRAKAIENGLVTPGQAANLSRGEVLNLIFAPGLSTAAQQTDVSGRGVGMDVVQRNIVQAGGRTSVESTPGKGTTLTVQIPLSSTLMVTEALLVDIGGCTYFVPNSYVHSIMKRDNRLVQHTPGGRELVMVNNSVLGVVHTTQALGHEPCEAGGHPYWIVVSKGERSLCLQVDHIRGIEEIVISELSSLLNGAGCVEGAAFTREGDIALVLSIPWFLRCAGTTSERREAAIASPN